MHPQTIHHHSPKIIRKERLATRHACGSENVVRIDQNFCFLLVGESCYHNKECLTGKRDIAIVLSSDLGYFLGEWRMFDERLMHEPSIRVP
jgi:hypothetical protein